MTFKGKHHLEKSKRKMSESHKGKKNHLGKKHSKKARLKMSISHWSKKEGYTNHWLGRKHNKKSINKMKEIKIGKNNPSWKGGITPINKKIRHSQEYKLWRKSVFERDNYTCRFCGKRGGTLHADHIKPFSLFPELRFAIDNGRTLCIDCHRETDSYGGKSV